MGKLIFFISIFTLCLSSCSNKTNSNINETQLTLESQIQNYPVPFSVSTLESYPVPESDKTDEIIKIENPEAGLSTLTGKISLRNGLILKNTTIYVTPGKGDKHDLPPKILIGPEVIKGDFASHTNQLGEFAINNITPGSYFLVASSTNSWWIIEDNDQKPINIVLEPNKILDIGEVVVYLP
jgi:hypothetical protein